MLESPESAAFFAVALLVFALSSCQALKRAAAPVAIFDARVSESPPDFCGQDSGGLDPGGLGLGVEFVASNLSGRPVKSVSVFVSVQERQEDSGQEDDYGGAFYEALWTLEDGLEAGQEEQVFVPLEDAPADCDADSLEIQSLYVESALYEDGEIWARRN